MKPKTEKKLYSVAKQLFDLSKQLTEMEAYKDSETWIQSLSDTLFLLGNDIDEACCEERD